jgi:uncharacterized protein (TIGR02265 family)
MSGRRIYDQSFEGLFVRGLGARLTPTVKQRLREAGLDLERKLEPAYPFEVWDRCVAIAVRELYSQEPEEVAYRLLGERLVHGYQETLMGRAMRAVLRLLGPRRLLARVGEALRSGNDYLTSRLTERGATEVELWANEVGLTRYLLQGALLAGLQLSQPAGKAVRVEVRGFDAEGVTFHISWDA